MILVQAKRIVVVAFGENKAGAVANCVEGGISHHCAASYLQEHANTLVHLDAAASMGESRNSFLSNPFWLDLELDATYREHCSQ